MIKETLNSEAVFILTSNLHNSKIAAEVLNDNGISAFACSHYDDLAAHVEKDAGVLIISDEALSVDEIFSFENSLKRQPAWSDIPIILLTSKSAAAATELYSRIGNISLLESPFSRLTLVRVVQVALRARAKQYQVRDLLSALNKAKDEAERANTAKTEFLANMSHEIRSPIGAILGFLDLMKDPKNESDENLNYMGIVERNSQQLLRLIDDILDLSKVEAGKMTIEQVDFNLTDLLNDLSSIMSFKAAEKGIAFLSILEGPIPDQICSDPVRLRQILGNILGNAIKFTSRGFVKLEVEYKNEMLHFIVKDSGVGISSTQLKKLFQPFSQADTSTTRKFGGTGLGLVLSKRLSEALGGTLELVESELGRGSTFKIVIKPKQVPGSKMVFRKSGVDRLENSSTNHSKRLENLKVLVVEDSDDNQTLISTILNMSGARVMLASNGKEGVDLALKEDFDVVLMDVQMPVMDGHEATRSLRKIDYKKPIVALTAHAMEEERKRCFESGYSEFLTKPIKKDNLLTLLSKYIPTYS